MATAALGETQYNACCREQEVYPSELVRWRDEAMPGAGQYSLKKPFDHQSIGCFIAFP